MATTIRICMLNADVPVPAVFTQRAPTYGRIFHELLAKASTQVTIESEDFDVQEQHYPETIDEFDAIVISGSANSAYDDIPWIHRLDAYVRDVYTNHPRVKIFGSCFGHQLMCQSLLKEYGVKVEADSKGFEIGVKEITLHQQFRETFAKNNESHQILGEGLRLQFVHHDHVVISKPELVPQDWMTLGSTEHCAVQGVYQEGRILTLQGHFEFDRFVNCETIKTFFAGWEPPKLQAALDDIDADDDAIAAAEMVLKFFVQEPVKRDGDHSCHIRVEEGVESPTEGDHLKSVLVGA